MKRYLGVLLVSLFFVGCATTPKLGYPEKDVPLPTNVTVFWEIGKEDGTISNRLPLLPAGVWAVAYESRIKDVLKNADKKAIINSISDGLTENMGKYTDLFIVDGDIKETPVHYDKSQNMEKKYSGYDFSSIQSEINTKYVLIFKINNYGYVAAQNMGAVAIYYSIGLINKETNELIWSYGKETMSAVKAMTPRSV